MSERPELRRCGRRRLPTKPAEPSASSTSWRISTAIAALEEIRRLHRDAAWPILPDRYNALRKSLITIRGSDLQLSEEQQGRIQDAVVYLAELETMVEVGLEQKRAPQDVARWNVLASGHILELHSLLLELRSRVGVS
jgi:hypothetical protein